MHQIDDAVVRGGKILLSDLPFADGQRVRVIVAESDAPVIRLPIAEVRRQLKGGVERFDDPCEPMIPTDDWEMLK
jgi:hypothetical protein